jgi:hypothetical protein
VTIKPAYSIEDIMTDDTMRREPSDRPDTPNTEATGVTTPSSSQRVLQLNRFADANRPPRDAGRFFAAEKVHRKPTC